MEASTCRVYGQLSAKPLRFGNFPTKSTFLRLRTLTFRRWCISAACTHCSNANLNSDTKTSDMLEPTSQRRMFILGMGFVSQFFAHQLHKDNWVVSGTCTSIEKKKKLEDMGFNMHLFNADLPDLSTLNMMKDHTHLLISIPPVVGSGDPMLHHRELSKNTLLDGNLEWLCYLSSTSVYGDYGGRWVNEDSPTNPRSESGKLRLAAEEGWLNLGHDLGIFAQVFRLGGIYGPGRSAVDTVIKQEPLSESQKSRASRQYTSRIHVEDICQALRASMKFMNKSFGKIYNIVDDDPAPREQVFEFAEILVERKWPGLLKQRTPIITTERFEKIQNGGSRVEKRVSNARMKKELGVKLLHPSYRSGLQSIIDEIENPIPRNTLNSPFIDTKTGG